jgi:hypothetical protein
VSDGPDLFQLVEAIVYGPTEEVPLPPAECERRLRLYIADHPDLSTLGRDWMGFSILLVPVMGKRPDLVRLLVDAGASLNCEADRTSEPRPNPDTTTLHFAADDGDPELIKLLLLAGGSALLGVFDVTGCTPLHSAASSGHAAAVDLLIRAGSDVNARDMRKFSDTPLDLAVKGPINQERFEVIRQLIDAGADPMIPTWCGMTAVERAAVIDEGSAEVLAILRPKTGMDDAAWAKYLKGVKDREKT